MILGIGTDLCQISRIRKAATREAFISRTFHPRERSLLLERSDPAPGLAASFAAKEAFAKAGGWGLGRVGLQSVWVDRSLGKPSLIAEKRALLLLEEVGCRHIHLSLSHEGDYALAFVVLES